MKSTYLMRDIDDIRRDNLKIIESEAGGPTAAAASLHMSTAQFTNLRDGAKDSKTGKPRGMRKDTARKIEAAAGKHPGWMDVDHSDAEDTSASLSMRRVYVVHGLASGGLRPDRAQDSGNQHADTTGEYAELGTSDPGAFLFEIKGPSMYPKYESGNFALVEPNAPIDIEDVVLVQPKEGEPMIKRLLSKRNKRYTFGSYNDSEIFEYKHEEVSWMYYCAHEVPRKRIKSRF